LTQQFSPALQMQQVAATRRLSAINRSLPGTLGS
jgi:hypothetical protein